MPWTSNPGTSAKVTLAWVGGSTVNHRQKRKNHAGMKRAKKAKHVTFSDDNNADPSAEEEVCASPVPVQGPRSMMRPARLAGQSETSRLRRNGRSCERSWGWGRGLRRRMTHGKVRSAWLSTSVRHWTGAMWTK
eukprot:1114807-Prymnesium_polylepis.1